jgi:hypothetical protein
LGTLICKFFNLNITFTATLENQLSMLFINGCSANLEKIRVLPNLYVLIIQLLVRNERYAELGLFVVNKVTGFSV